MLLALAPLVVLALLTGALRSGQAAGGTTLRESILAAGLIVGVTIALGTEALSAFRLLTRTGIAGFWLVAIAAAAVVFVQRRRRFGRPARLVVPELDVVDTLLLGGIATMASLLLVVAWLAPPQSSDALSYHMGRVMHWAQNGSLAPFPTIDSRQLYHPPFAEMVHLHLFLLTGSDQPGCLLQWLAAMGTLLAATLLARDLGGGRRAQIFAAFVAITLPIGVTQATAGKNGWVEALWLLSLACFSNAVSHRAEAVSSARVLASFAAFGLGLATKLTSWFFAGPVAVLAAVRLLRGHGIRGVTVPAAVGVALVCALTFPFFARNVAVYGNPVVDPIARAHTGLQYVTPAVVVSNAIRNAFYQLGTPSRSVNDALEELVFAAHRLIDVDPFDARTSQSDPFRVSPPTRIEELAYSPFHILLLAGTSIALLVSRRLRAGGPRLSFLVAIVTGYVLFCSAVTWQAPNCRLLMPLLLLASPLVAVVVADAGRRWALEVIAVVLLLAALPYALDTEGRPLSLESNKGILVTPRKDLYFARVRYLRSTYLDVARAVKESGAQNVGLVMKRRGDPEYLLWVVLRDAARPVRIEHVNVDEASGRFASEPLFRDFRPELVVVVTNDRWFDYKPVITASGARLRFLRRTGFAAVYQAIPDLN